MSKEKVIFLWFVLFSLLVLKELRAQDIHFSQFLAAPYTLNPALTGAFDGDARFTANQRTQWRSITTPYQTLGGFIDLRNAGVKNFHPGLSVYNDKAGDSKFKTFQFNLSAAYSILLNRSNNHKITAGIQTGITQRRIDYDNLNFDNQYNGIKYDPQLNSGEDFARIDYMYFNLNTGVIWSFRINKEINISSGFAVFNINKPDQSFYDREKINLDRRYTLFCKAEFRLNRQTHILPSLLMMRQGSYQENLLGSSVKFTLEDVIGQNTAIYAGTWFRMRDAGYLLIGMDYNDLYVGISYDFNYSNLVPASNYKGGFEVSVIYILKKFLPKRTKYNFCPSFI